VKPDGVYYYHTDPAGSPLAMTNNSKTVVWKADYRPFGEEQSKTLNFSNDRMFAGKERDRETGMYYFGARYMRPENGRFTTIDPIGPVDARTGKVNDKMLVNPQRLNRYAYALNNPYRYVDPDGLFEITIVEMGEKNGAAYAAKIKVIGDNGKIAEVRGSTWPNPNNPSPGIADGTYDAIYSITGHKGASNGVRLENGSKIPTLGPNPAQNNQRYATGVNVHSGYNAMNRGSAGCITVNPSEAQKVWDVLKNGETGTVTISRKPVTYRK